MAYDDGWKEIRDTHLMPGESRKFIAEPLPEKTSVVRYRVTVIPDNFYKGTYQSLLKDDLTGIPKIHINHALERAGKNDYLLYEQAIHLSALH